MKIFVLGSIAWDETALFEGRFKDVIHAEHLDKLSVSFVVQNNITIEGGCAGNIAYAMGLLGVPAWICGLLGNDGEAYRARLLEMGHNCDELEMIPGSTAKASVISDLDENQIAFFAPGVIGKDAPTFHLPKNAEAGDILWIGPENIGRMMQALRTGREKGLRIYFDPGQVIHVFSKEELEEAVRLSNAIFLNDYEWELLQKKLDRTAVDLEKDLDQIVVTRAAEPALAFDKGSWTEVPSLQIENVANSTGAGDAFRGGFLAALDRGLPFLSALAVGHILAAASIQTHTPQNYQISEDLKQSLKTLGFPL